MNSVEVWTSKKEKEKKNCLLEKYGYNWWELDIVEMDLNLLEFLC